MRVTKTLEIISDDLTLNDESEINPKLDGALFFEVPDVEDKDCVVDLKIGTTHIGWMSKEALLDLSHSIIEQITPLVSSVQSNQKEKQ